MVFELSLLELPHWIFKLMRRPVDYDNELNHVVSTLHIKKYNEQFWDIKTFSQQKNYTP